MKKNLFRSFFSALILCLCLFALPIPGRAQDSAALTPGSTITILTNLTAFLATSETVTNWTFIPYASRAAGLVDDQGQKAEWGGGVAALYPVWNDGINLRTGFRLQYFAGQMFLPSVNAQVSTTYQLFGGATWTPFLFTGIAMPVGGSQQNGDVGLLYGGGVSLKYPINDKWDVGLAYAWEEWSALKVRHVEHFGLVLNYKF